MSIDELGEIGEIVQTIDVGFEARKTGVDDTLRLCGDEHVIETVHDWLDGSFHRIGRFGVHVNAIDVVNMIDEREQTFELFDIVVDKNRIGQRHCLATFRRIQRRVGD